MTVYAPFMIGKGVHPSGISADPVLRVTLYIG